MSVTFRTASGFRSDYSQADAFEREKANDFGFARKSNPTDVDCVRTPVSDLGLVSVASCDFVDRLLC